LNNVVLGIVHLYFCRNRVPLLMERAPEKIV